MALQCSSISLWHSEMDLSDRRQAAICSCRVAILSRVSLADASRDGTGALLSAAAGALSANAVLLSAISKALAIAVTMTRAEFAIGMALSSCGDCYGSDSK